MDFRIKFDLSINKICMHCLIDINLLNNDDKCSGKFSLATQSRQTAPMKFLCVFIGWGSARLLQKREAVPTAFPSCRCSTACKHFRFLFTVLTTLNANFMILSSFRRINKQMNCMPRKIQRRLETLKHFLPLICFMAQLKLSQPHVQLWIILNSN